MLLGKTASLDLKLETEAQAAVLVEEAVRTAEIEGQALNRDAVRSSVVVRLVATVSRATAYREISPS